MDIHITTRHCTLSDVDHEAAIEAAKHFEKFYSTIIRVDAIVEEGPLAKSCEYTVKIAGQLIVAKESGPDFAKAIHDSAQKIQRQLTKIHDKQTSH
ncbi:MAG: ribosome-associated translation inhibitor RaiA [Candidatus Kapabacteria bacterium]|nr:ribosome-associated translation inhibitor RaiA [Candidatus Kapabacteria bacterium]